jgi:hypothetical protein
MKLKPILAAAGLALASAGAFADVFNVALPGAPSTTNFSSADTSPFTGGSDTVTFSGLSDGAYNVFLALTGTGVKFDAATSTLNGISGQTFANGIIFNAFGVASTPLVLNLFGTDTNGIADSSYGGSITVTAVPEPETYALMLAGLGVIGFLARRRRPQL